ncbi:hypothetical protein V498_10154 [Pseudogymnoascus sp. VKM F-4517 (FW-2822)]|nr:hypothetical protein V498_10154 [Pseudogymnoascus sp. VKM F-4517 (FW-2822)]
MPNLTLLTRTHRTIRRPKTTRPRNPRRGALQPRRRRRPRAQQVPRRMPVLGLELIDDAAINRLLAIPVLLVLRRRGAVEERVEGPARLEAREVDGGGGELGPREGVGAHPDVEVEDVAVMIQRRAVRGQEVEVVERAVDHVARQLAQHRQARDVLGVADLGDERHPGAAFEEARELGGGGGDEGGAVGAGDGDDAVQAAREDALVGHGVFFEGEGLRGCWHQGDVDGPCFCAGGALGGGLRGA